MVCGVRAVVAVVAVAADPRPCRDRQDAPGVRRNPHPRRHGCHGRLARGHRARPAGRPAAPPGCRQRGRLPQDRLGPAAAARRHRCRQGQRVDRGDPLPARQRPLRGDAARPVHVQRARLGAARRARRPHRLPARRDVPAGRPARLGQAEGVMAMALALEMPTDPPLPLRPYQAQALDPIGAAHARAAIGRPPARGATRQLVVLPTGGGKTVVFAHLVNRRPGRALVLAHRDELITQAAGKLALVGGSLDIGVVKAKQDDRDARVVVASVQTLARPGRVARLGKFSTVIVDEAHHAVADTYMGILAELGCMDAGGPLTVGFTATAGRSDKIGLRAAWEEITYQRGIVQMIAEGYLCDVRAIEIGTDFDLGNVQTRAGDYTDSSIGAELERSDALDAAAKAYGEYAKDRLGVAFTPTIATAHALAEKLRAKGIPAEAVDGTMHTDTRRGVLRSEERRGGEEGRTQ